MSTGTHSFAELAGERNSPSSTYDVQVRELFDATNSTAKRLQVAIIEVDRIEKELRQARYRLVDAQDDYRRATMAYAKGPSRRRAITQDFPRTLSEREHEVLDLGTMTVKETANKLNISESTVRFHRKNITRKFGVNRMIDVERLLRVQ